jgi:hypothetical protein
VFDAHIRFVVDQMRAAYKGAEIANLLALYVDMKDAGFSSAAIAVALEGEIGRMLKTSSADTLVVISRG